MVEKIKTSYCKGVFYEKLVMDLLNYSSFTILHSRYKTKFGEIDIIAKKKQMLLFGEVKYRSNNDSLYDALSTRQINKIQDAAEYFMMTNIQYMDFQKRIDYFTINKSGNIDWIKNISF